MISKFAAPGISFAMLILAACASPPPPPPPAPVGTGMGTPGPGTTGQPAYSTGSPRESEHGTVQR